MKSFNPIALQAAGTPTSQVGRVMAVNCSFNDLEKGHFLHVSLNHVLMWFSVSTVQSELVFWDLNDIGWGFEQS
jgi:hypothetical protein